MTDPPRPNDDEILTSLARQIPPAESPCLSAEQLAAYCEAALMDEERLAAESHLAACGACSAEVADLIRGGLPQDSSETQAFSGNDRLSAWRRFRPWAGIAAALILLIAGGTAFFLMREKPASAEAQLLAEVDALKRAHPEVFQNFTPVGSDERHASPRRETQRAEDGITILAPNGRILPELGAVVVKAPAAAWTYTVLVINDAGETILTAHGNVTPSNARAVLADGSHSVFQATIPATSKPLPAGHYLIEVTVSSALGRGMDRRPIDVAGDDDRAAFESGRRIIESSVAPGLRPLVLAHFAWRRGFLGDALLFAAEAHAQNPANPVARETLDALRSL